MIKIYILSILDNFDEMLEEVAGIPAAADEAPRAGLRPPYPER
jgi:hypothetical protein